MDGTSAGIESELLDLSSVPVTALRAVDPAILAPSTERVMERIADAEGSISGYNESFSAGMRSDARASAGCDD